MVNIPLFTGVHTCWVLQDLFHQQYFIPFPYHFHQNSPFFGGQETRPIIPLPPNTPTEARGIEQAAQIADQGAGNLGVSQNRKTGKRETKGNSATKIRLGWIPGSWIRGGCGIFVLCLNDVAKIPYWKHHIRIKKQRNSRNFLTELKELKNKRTYQQTEELMNKQRKEQTPRTRMWREKDWSYKHVFLHVSVVFLQPNWSSTSICSRGIFTVPKHDFIDSSLAKLKTTISSTVQISSTTRQKRKNML